MNTKFRKRLSLFLLLSLTVLSCKAAESLSLRFPSGALPEMETDAQAVVDTLGGDNWYMLGVFAEEQYAEENLTKPGVMRYTVQIKNDKPTYFNYGWCTTTAEILEQNYEHIRVELFFNGKRLGSDVVHTLTYNTPDGMFCGDYGVLFKKLPAGDHRIEAVATLDEEINDGITDYEAGEYYYEYNVSVAE
jgi:hypothetical protein